MTENHSSPATVVTTYFDAVSKGDIPTAMAQFSPDAV